VLAASILVAPIILRWLPRHPLCWALAIGLVPTLFFWAGFEGAWWQKLLSYWSQLKVSFGPLLATWLMGRLNATASYRPASST
jgi:hypothetical protein